MSEANGAAMTTHHTDTIARLSAERARLAKTLGTLRQLLGVQTRDEIEAAVRKLTETRDLGDKAIKELAELKQRTASPDDKDKRIAELEGKIKTRDFTDAFRAAVKAKGGNPDKADDLLKLSDLSPPDGEMKPEFFDEFLGKAQESHPWAFETQQPGKAASGGGATQPPGSGRAASAPPSAQVRYTREQINTYGWEKQHPELVEAFQKGTAVLAE